jgi:pimeloyl-ACP methyl ester carboxylesterase
MIPLASQRPQEARCRDFRKPASPCNSGAWIVATLLAGVAALLGVAPSNATGPYPIVFVHGLMSSDAMWAEEGGILAHLNSMGWTSGRTMHFVLGQTDRLSDVDLLYESCQLAPCSDTGELWAINFESASDPSSNKAAIFLQAQAVQLAIERVKFHTGRDKVILVGHSMGGLAAATYLAGYKVCDGSERFFANDVAKLVTLGTPFNGSDIIRLATIFGGAPLLNMANAFRDLSKNSVMPICGFHKNVFLFRGQEAEVSSCFVSSDVNSNGTVDSCIRNGIQDFDYGTDWPAEVDYTFLIGELDSTNGDCAVEAVDQVPSDFSDFVSAGVKSIDAGHTSLCAFTFCTEAKSLDALVEALDEASYLGKAWKFPLSANGSSGEAHGFLTQLEEAGTDFDYYQLSATGVGTVSATLIPPAVASGVVQDLHLRLLNSAGALACPSGCEDSTAPFQVSTSLASSSPTDLILEVSGTVAPSLTGAGIGGSATACNAATTACPNCRNPYRLSLSTSTGPSLISMSAIPGTVGIDQFSTLQASLVGPTGVPAPAGASVIFSTTYPGAFVGCSGSTSGCAALTNSSGIAQVTFSSSQVGTATVAATAPTGGQASATVTIGLGSTSILAVPNPVQLNSASQITATIRNGGGILVGAGRIVTFSTSFPGGFSGTGCTTSPCTATTNAASQALINFTPWASGIANITIETPGSQAMALALESTTPPNNLSVQLSIGYRNGGAGSTTYEVEAYVANPNGTPVIGERVDFTTSRGSLSASWNSTAVTGIAQTLLTVTTSGDTTVTATARGTTAATSFNAQIGTIGAVMAPVREYSLTGEVYGLAYAPDCSALVAADYNGNVRAWNTSDGSQRWSATTNDNRAGQVSVAPAGARVLVAHDGGVDTFSMSNGALNCTASAASGDEAINAVFSSDSTFLRTGDGSSTIAAQMYRHSSLCQATGSPIFTPAGDDFQHNAHLDFSSQKNWAAVVSHNGQLYVRSASSNSSVFTDTMSSGSSRGHDTDFNADGSKLLAVGWGPIKYYNTSTWSFTSYSAPYLGADGVFGAKLIDGDSKIAVAGNGKIEILNVAGGGSYRQAVINGEGLEIDWCPSRSELAVGTSGGSVQIFRPFEPLDSAAPVISVTAPENGLTTNATSVVSTGRVTDASAISSFTVNGGAAALDAQGYFSMTVPLSPGANVITYAAQDALGNAASMLRTVTRMIDTTAPVVSNVASTPPSGVAGTDFVISALVVDGESGVASATVTIRSTAGQVLAQLSMTAGVGGLYTASYGSAGQAPAVYSLDITAVDASPQANSRTVLGAATFEVEPPPAMQVSPMSSDFGLVLAGSSADRPFIVTNTGGGTLAGAASVGSPFSVVSGETYSLGRLQSATVIIRFTPVTPGLVQTQVSFTGAGGASRSVTGTGVLPAALIAVAPLSLDFGQVNVSNCGQLTVSISNVGDALLAGSMSVGSPFSVASGGTYSLAPGEQQVGSLTFCPVAQGVASAQVQFTGGGGASLPAIGYGWNGDIFTDGFETGTTVSWSSTQAFQ